ncbi:hypothetical protein KGQ19_14960 [Catenulispora sp. NL8]|uniref:Class I SAM-dependent methyltransferase n=1 Tax=Catenulispora pinistramenti TaxID=2705254 RepID=A0ABS5KQ63_9ACTN|nr:hypothetical protein [Catenulispora pinistramenti]MBS2548166.1 hypothetical protein [Catenulispora pinistramenti]
MAELALTQERREQLRSYLSDEQLLGTEYPEVARYLDAAVGLAGTGDSEADASFDVRLLHFMTGGRAESQNPYWEIVAPSVSELDGRRVVNGGHPNGSARLAFAQMTLQATYAYAIPSPETIEWMSGICADRPIVELGAGRGYWASQLDQAGHAVTAYELEPPDTSENVSFPKAAGQDDIWHPVSHIDGHQFEDHSDSVLFLCWPPGWGNTMASAALNSFESSGGTQLIFVGEPKGGKTGDDAFFDALTEGWVLQSADPAFVSWWNLADVAQAWVRR